MKNKFLIFCASLFLFSCTATEPNPNVTAKNVTYKIIYTVNPSSTQLDVLPFTMFLDANSNRIGATYPSGWQFSLTPTNLPYTAELIMRANSNTASYTATLQILVNGTVVKELVGVSVINSAQKSITYTVN
jgi:hypothetical protein